MAHPAEIQITLRSLQGVNNMVRGLSSVLEDLSSRSKRIQHAEKNRQPIRDQAFQYDLKGARKELRQIGREVESVQPKLRKISSLIRHDPKMADQGKLLSQIVRGMRNTADNMHNFATTISRALGQTNFKVEAIYLANDCRGLIETISSL